MQHNLKTVPKVSTAVERLMKDTCEQPQTSPYQKRKLKCYSGKIALATVLSSTVQLPYNDSQNCTGFHAVAPDK